MRIAGIDCGLNITGYGIIESDDWDMNLVEAGVIRTRVNQPLEKRVMIIHDELESVLDEFKPDIMIVEDLYSHYAHPKTAIIMGHARGAIFLSAAHCEIPVVSYSATHIKKSLTGNGRAPKDQVNMMVKDILNVKGEIKPSDVSDALACAITHARMHAEEGLGI
ncbi:crossover junction endodeoxyribonuclease RuvC [bacterium]|nr:crossover junction endodeoxyribonuclease RuvC [bacterium]